jgi:spore photoproduct lyase
MSTYYPELILVHEKALQDGATREILDRLRGIETRIVSEIDVRSCDNRTLALVHHHGKFLKKCQGSGAEICCGYLIASYAWNCHLDCTYCVLRSYLGSEAILISTNIDALMKEVKDAVEQQPERIFRIGTGELADSLALDHITLYSQKLVPFFASLHNGILELKTKSVQIENLQDLDHGGRTVVSWSMNSKHICQTEERNAPGFEARLAAAVKCQKWGYKLGFHFDPIVFYEEWERDYREAVKDILHAVDSKNIAWISLGALRFTPNLREKVRRRFPESKVPYGEFVPGHHGKLRYFRPIREEMYRKMESWIHEEAPQVFVYLCMESCLVWKRSFGRAPLDTSELSQQMDRRAGSGR